jgi:hypothetical protein
VLVHQRSPPLSTTHSPLGNAIKTPPSSSQRGNKPEAARATHYYAISWEEWTSGLVQSAFSRCGQATVPALRPAKTVLSCFASAALPDTRAL